MNKIALVVSDVDGTLVTSDKRLTDAAQRAVAQLSGRGIQFAITSSRPPFGMKMLVEPLKLQLPLGAFNGSSVVDVKFNLVEHHTIPAEAARTSMDMLRRAGVDIWLFTDNAWIIENNTNTYVGHEKLTIKTDPTIVHDLTDYADRACKIVGVSAQAASLAETESALQHALGNKASAVRSQSYYLDITPAGFDKGTFVDTLRQQLNLTQDRIATIGDMRNDLAMFAKSGLSFAMGNATDEVKGQATRVTGANDEDGFAGAIEYILSN